MNDNEYDVCGLDKGITNINTQPKGECNELPSLRGPDSGTLSNSGTTKAKPKSYSYLLTIKCHAKVHVDKDTLDKVLQEIKGKVNRSHLSSDWSSLIGYEEDSVGRMHVHTYLVTKKPVFMKKYQKPGWSIHFSDRKDGKQMTGARAIRYIMKLDQSENAVRQRFDVNQFKFSNRFLPQESMPKLVDLLD